MSIIMKPKNLFFMLYLILSSYLILPASHVRAETISFGCPAWGFCSNFQTTADQWGEMTGNVVKLYESGRLVDDSLGFFRQILSTRSDEFDIILIDCIWPGMLGKHLVNLKDHISENHIQRHFKPLIANYTDDKGRLVAMPLFTDAGVLYYRKDLLDKHGFSPPKTWKEMASIAAHIMDAEKHTNPDLTGYIFQGKAYEGLTCNALEWISSHGGGTFIDEKNGKVTVNNPRAIAALKMAQGWINTISTKNVLHYTEIETTNHFRSGNAIFMRNWIEPWEACNDEASKVRGKTAVTALPKADSEHGKHAATIGDMSLAISRYSKNVDLSVELIRFMTAISSQKYHSMAYSFTPTISSLFDDPELMARRPFMPVFKGVLKNGISRPSRLTGTKYAGVSRKISTAVYAVLSGELVPEKAMTDLEIELNNIRGGGW